MSNLSIQEALDYCLENPDGLSAQELLDRFPQYRAELSDMLLFANELAEITPPPVMLERREAMKSRIMMAAQTQANAARVARPAALVKPARVAKPLPWFLRPGWVTAAAAIIILMFVWWSADRALPDSPFYNVKLASENIILNLTSKPVDKAILNTNIANARLYDLRAMQQTGKLVQAAPALESYSRRVTEANAILLTLEAGEPRARVAEAVYKTCRAGQVTLGGIETNLSSIPNIPQTFSESLDQTQATVDTATQNAATTLVTEGLDPATIVFELPLAQLLTPVVPVPSTTVSPTASLPSETSTVPAADVTATIGAVITSISIEETPTESSGEPATETPAAEATAAPSETQAAATLTALSTGTPTSEPTKTPENQATPTLAPQSSPTGKPTDTLTPTSVVPTFTTIPGGKATQTPTETANIKPSSTATPTTEPFVPSPTLTPVQPVLPAPTSPALTPTSSISGPEATATYTPTSTTTPTYTPTPTPTNTPTATDTPTQPLPTFTAVPPTATDTPEPTHTPSPTATEPIAASVCDLKIDRVTSECAGTCASWTATISNTGEGLVEADWVAELEVKAGSGGFQVVDTTDGTVSVGAHSQVQISDPFCYDFPPNASQFRVRVHLVTGGEPCNIPAKMSPATNVCTVK